MAICQYPDAAAFESVAGISPITYLARVIASIIAYDPLLFTDPEEWTYRRGQVTRQQAALGWLAGTVPWTALQGYLGNEANIYIVNCPNVFDSVTGPDTVKQQVVALAPIPTPLPTAPAPDLSALTSAEQAVGKMAHYVSVWLAKKARQGGTLDPADAASLATDQATLTRDLAALAAAGGSSTPPTAPTV
ncbi:MAG: hypothetical protein ACYDAK_13045 [Candidatus Limnocylindrales bacterium]